MYQRKERAENSYYPAFLYMDVDTPDYLHAIAHLPMDERTEAAFLHEYIHYLQDVTTLSGYTKIGVIVDQMKWAISQKLNGTKVHIPFDPCSTSAYNMLPNEWNRLLNKGHFKIPADRKISEVISFDKKETSVSLEHGIKKRIKMQAVLTFKADNGTRYEYTVGEMAISESMAYLIENALYKDVLSSPPDCPYRVVQKIVENICPRLNTTEKMVALCDVALMHQYPGYALYNIIEEINKNNIPDPSIAYIYMLGLNKEVITQSGIKDYWYDFDRMNLQAANQLGDYFREVPYWQGNFNDISLAFNNALWLRKNRMGFMIDILREGRIYQNKTLKQILFGYLGCMCVQTSTNMIFNIAPVIIKNPIEFLYPQVSEIHVVPPSTVKTDAELFIALKQIHEIFFSEAAIQKDQTGQKQISMKCKLQQWCRNSFNHKGELDLTSNGYNCSLSPWLNVNEEELKQCAFGRLWAAYGLHQIKLLPSK